MKTLIIPDVHHKIKWADKIQETERGNYDETVFLGDYFDDWNDTPEDATRTAKWLKAKLDEPETRMLLGNHDLSYGYKGIFTCSGYSKAKDAVIHEILQRDDFDRLLPYVRVGGWLLTHAGFDAHMLGPAGDDPENALKNYERSFEHMHKGILQKSDHKFFLDQGPLWVRPLEFFPIKGVNQIFGHTIVKEPRMSTFVSKSLCLDSNGRHYALLDPETEVVEIKQVDWKDDATGTF